MGNKIKTYLIIARSVFAIATFAILGILYTGSSLIYFNSSQSKTGKIASVESSNNQRFAYLQSINFDSLNMNVLGQSEDIALSVPVLLYHGILEEKSYEGVDFETFKEQMLTLKKAGYQTIGIKDFYDFVKGKRELPAKSFLLTFDDGRKDSYYPVDPILEKLNYRAVMFVITGKSIGRNSDFYLNEEEIVKMSQSGRWDIQSHSNLGHDLYRISVESDKKGYFFSNLLWSESKNRLETAEEFSNRIEEDLVLAKVRLENLTGEDVISFAYPFGDYGQKSKNFPESANITPKVTSSIYPISFYQTWIGGVVRNYPNINQSMFKRINVEPSWDANKLLAVLENSMDKNLPYFDNFAKDNGWKPSWGNVQIQNNELIISAKPDAKSAMAILDGTSKWENIGIEIKVKSVNGSTVSIVARKNEEGEFIKCVFGNKYVSYRVFKNNLGIRKVSVKRESILEGKTLGMQVDEEKIKCLINNVAVIDIRHQNKIPSNGRIGLEVWTDSGDASRIVVENVQVKKL